jgi:Vitamin B12 dependent methionine synthase, activation domain
MAIMSRNHFFQDKLKRNFIMKESEYSQNRHINTSSRVVHFAPDEIITTSRQVCRYAGGIDYKMNSDTSNLVSEILQQARQLITPALVYAIHPVSERLGDKTLILQNRTSLVLPPREREVHTRYIAAVVCTLGEALEITCRQFAKQSKFLESIFLDAAGVALLEALAERAYELISQKAGKKNLYVGCRFAPGYAGMPMSSQTLLFNLVDGAAIGVQLNDRWIMKPSKSLSFFIRLTDHKTPLRGIYKCETCPVTDCNFRIRRAGASSQR